MSTETTGKKLEDKTKGTRLSIVIGRGFGLIILFLLIVGGVSIVGLINTAEEYNVLLDSAVELDDTAMEITISLGKALRAEKEFWATGDQSILDDHDEYVQEVIALANHVKTLQLNDEMFDDADQIITNINLYNTLADEISNIRIGRGGGVFGDSKGVVGDMKSSGDELIEDALEDYTTNLMTEIQYFKLVSLYQTIRLNENEYLGSRLLGEDYQVHLTEMSSDITEFNTIITSLTLITEVRKNEYKNDWIAYSAFLTSLVTLDDDIDTKMGNVDDTAKIVQALADELEEDAVLLRKTQQGQVDDAVQSILIMAVVVIVLGVIVSIGITLWMTRGLTTPIYKLEDEVATIGRGDLTTSFAFEKRPALELVNLGVNVDAMKTSLLSIISSIGNANEILNTTSEDLLSGAEEINASAEEVASTSQAMSNGATSQTELIADVNEDINGINSMVDGIIKKIQANTEEVSQIALQTNILALNAGIEASRAGDYGRGFAVVAENVRKLSDQSKSAAEQIAIVANEIADKLQNSFDKISSSMVNVVSVSEETAASAEEVAAAAEEMTSTIEELSSAAQELTTQAENSQKEIAQFTVK